MDQTPPTQTDPAPQAAAVDPHTKQVLEAILFAYGEPMPVKRILELLSGVSTTQLRTIVETLNVEYQVAGRAFAIQEVAGSYQLMTRKDLAPWVAKALQHPRPDAVSTASMETLAIVAYRQPMTKAEIEAVRGVDVTAAIDTLVEKKFIRISGRKETPGRPFLYSTTADFLRHFGLRSIEALPDMPQPAIQEPVSDAPQPPVLSRS